MRALHGMTESRKSNQRIYVVDMFLKQYGLKDKAHIDKYERLGFDISYEHPKGGGDIKIIDCTQKYKEGFDIIYSFKESEHIQDLPDLALVKKLNELSGHKVGRVLIEVQAPISPALENEVQSPVMRSRKSKLKISKESLPSVVKKRTTNTQ